MRIAIHPDDNLGTSFSTRWIEFFAQRGVEVKIVNLLARDFVEQLAGCDGVMWRWFHLEQDKQSVKTILYVIENYLKIPVFPDNATGWHFDEKVAQWYLFRVLDVPQPETWIFWDKESSLQWAKSAPYPVVFKLSVGAGSSSVLKVKSEDEAAALIERMFDRGIFPMTMNEFKYRLLPGSRRELKITLARPLDALRYVVRNEYPRLPKDWWKPERGYVLFQEFLPNNDFDTRVTVVGSRAFAFRRMNRPGDFRASGSGNIDWSPEAIDKRCLKMAFDISRQAKFQTMAFDFLYRNGEPVVCEASYTFVSSAVHSCPGHWDPELNWHEGQMWPEEAQVEDFLAEIQARSVAR
ncbi:ATP-grasp domain-containing protein [Geomonas propionica]|uniref:ATP-grasp domain-containing protein n=1 Tax=Geomonas propionica TaxID=2798582 RepID=A0ABS0YWW8_9BACT|nr:hypothetical protein [Geomonas propionica]MBJ6802450.1 hypothetical protein [Geomonas propionica]